MRFGAARRGALGSRPRTAGNAQPGEHRLSSPGPDLRQRRPGYANRAVAERCTPGERDSDPVQPHGRHVPVGSALRQRPAVLEVRAAVLRRRQSPSGPRRVLLPTQARVRRFHRRRVGAVSAHRPRGGGAHATDVALQCPGGRCGVREDPDHCAVRLAVWRRRPRRGKRASSEVRNAFNSPFWPFVLASTSVGQEGIDFHWWSHSVVHWNLPFNPVDFEQREGRVNRFGGHAVRKNVASAHGRHALAVAKSGKNPWLSAFDAAVDHPELGEFSPWWIYPGAAQVERLLVHFPLSRDEAQYTRLRDSLTLYRLMLGQPRQEDMLELLHQRGVTEGGVTQLDLRPPHRAKGEERT
ncbi:C-terminal helicase domain-containing protein [Mycolicibacterium pallens]|uniref:C-terminal helicase domain-containing protein n=1 Tax=Mycolicibacterium pallens TaxID=370524 RepID=UPI001CEC0EA5|nr:helicase-related protein [Mycolicibacterium pallens]